MLAPSLFANESDRKQSDPSVTPPLLVSPKAETSQEASETSDLYFIKGRQKALEGKFDEAVVLFEQALGGSSENAFIHHQLAEAYLRLQKEDRAETAAKKAVELDPNNIEYRTTLAAILTSLKRYEEAKIHYGKIQELDGSNEKAVLLLGILEVESGQVDKGLATLSKAIERNNENALAYFYRAKVYLEMDEIKKAKADLDKCLGVRPNFVEAGMALGLLHERLGEVDEAIRVYSRIQGNGRYRKRLAQLYLQRNELEKALTELIEYAKVEPDDYTAKVKIGLIYFELKQYESAAEQFRTILNQEPSADNVRFYLAAVFEETKKYDMATAEFKKVTKESSFFKEAMLHIGFILKDQGKTREGIELGKRLTRESPEVAEFFDLHASFFEARKDYKQALKVIELGLKRHVNDEKLLYFEGALYERLDDKRRGIANMKKILQINPNNANALNFLGYSYAEAGENLEEAEKLILKAVELRPNDGYIIDSLGWVYFKQGKIDLALEHLEKAASIQPEEPIILEHLGDIYLKQKDTSKAMDLYRKAVALSDKKDKEMAKKLQAKIAAIEKEKRLPSGE